jgi:hypothetical protein
VLGDDKFKIYFVNQLITISVSNENKINCLLDEEKGVPKLNLVHFQIKTHVLSFHSRF